MNPFTPGAAQDLPQISRDLRSGALTSQALVEAALSRLATLEPRMQAFSYLDGDRALRHAKAIDQLRAAGIDLGPLMGLPVAVKDLLTINGMPTHAGSRVDIQDLVPAQGSFVAALNRAGCVVLGKTRTSEFAMGGYNPSHPLPWNPCDAHTQRMTGGSSHGSAVAMAAGVAAFTVGSDTGGSVRWPAGRLVWRDGLQVQRHALALRRGVPDVAADGQPGHLHPQRQRCRLGGSRAGRPPASATARAFNADTGPA